MKKIFLLIAIIFIFINLFAVSAENNETHVSEANTDEVSALSIETSISDESIYIGNQTEASITVKNVGNCEMENLSIISIPSLGHMSYVSGKLICSFDEGLYPEDGNFTNPAFCYNGIESSEGSWTHTSINDSTYGNLDCFILNDVLKMNQTRSFKVIYNTTKMNFYNYANINFFTFSNDVLLNNTCNRIEISQIPRKVLVNRTIQNDSLIINAEIISLDNSLFSGNLSVKVADVMVPSNFGPNEVFEKAEINFINNTGNSSLKLPLNKTTEYITGLLINIPKHDVYSYEFIYDEFDDSILQSPQANSATVDLNTTPAVSIETSVSNSTIYIGNSTEVTVTVKNVGNCDVNNLSIFNLQSYNSIEYWDDFGFISIIAIGPPEKLDTLHFNSFESINGSWNYTIVNDTTDIIHNRYGNYIVFNLTDTLKVNHSCSFKLIYNTTKKDFYNEDNLYFFMFSNNTLLNETKNTIKISQIPRTVYISRKIENNSLFVNATVSSLDNSVFSGELDIKVAENIFSPSYPEELFNRPVIKFVNNTGNVSIELPLTTYKKYATGYIPPGAPQYSVYSYRYVYDSFDEALVQKPYDATKDLVKIYKSDSQFVVNAKRLYCNNITFKINGVSYVREVNEAGFAKLNINLNPGVYTIESSTHNYQFNNTITVLPTLIGDNLVKYYMNDSQFDIKLIDSMGSPVASKNVTFNINGVFYSRQTNDEGIARLNINLSPREYIITAIDPLTGLKMSYNITVLPVLYGDDVLSYADGLYDYRVKLVDDTGNALSGQSVSFNVGGLIFNNITDANGEAKLFINLMPGKYIVTAQYLSAKISNNIIILEK